MQDGYLVTQNYLIADCAQRLRSWRWAGIL